MVQILEESLFYKEILGLFIDGYMDLIITGYLNQKILLYTTNGEKFGSYFSYFVLISCIVIMPILFIWIAFKN
jgi:hypothetical protein